MNKQEITVEQIVNLLTHDMKETEVIFDSLLKIKTSPHHLLCEISGVAVDGNDRLWIKNDRNNWTEVTDRLMYKNYILSSLNQRLKLLLTEVN